MKYFDSEKRRVTLLVNLIFFLLSHPLCADPWSKCEFLNELEMTWTFSEYDLSKLELVYLPSLCRLQLTTAVPVHVDELLHLLTALKSFINPYRPPDRVIQSSCFSWNEVQLSSSMWDTNLISNMLTKFQNWHKVNPTFYLSLVCNECNSVVHHFKRLKLLPNEHWIELLDCWSCHKQEFATVEQHSLNYASMSHPKHEDIVHVSHDKFFTVIKQQGHYHKEKLDCHLRCTTTADGCYNQEDFRIERDGNLVLQRSFEQVVHDVLRAQFDAHMTSKFALERSNRPILLIWVQSWSLGHYHKIEHIMKPSIKLLYKLMTHYDNPLDEGFENCLGQHFNSEDRLEKLLNLLDQNRATGVEENDTVDWITVYLSPV